MLPFYSGVIYVPLNVWMLHNNLKLNSDKSELLIFHAKHRPAPPLDCMNIGDLAISSSKSCMNISVTFDSYMNFDEHIKNICRKALRVSGKQYSLFPLGPVIKYLLYS